MSEVKNYRWEKNNIQLEISAFEKPQMIKGEDGWEDIESNFSEIFEYKDWDLLDGLSDNRLSDERLKIKKQVKKYKDLIKTFREPKLKGRIVLDTNDESIIDSLDIRSRRERERITEKEHGIERPSHFIWLEGLSGVSGKIIFPKNSYARVYKIGNDGDIREIPEYVEGSEKPYYKIENEETHVYMDSFSGAGTEEDPYLVETYEDLEKVGSGTDGWDLDSYYEQVADIVCSGEFSMIGDGDNPFTGQYDGNEHEIIDLKIDHTADLHTGLFSQTEAGAVIKNINLDNANVYGDTPLAVLIGTARSGLTLENCIIKDSVVTHMEGGSAFATGSIIGQFEGDSVTDCYSDNVTVYGGGEAVGGVIGFPHEVTPETEVKRCGSSNSRIEAVDRGNPIALGGFTTGLEGGQVFFEECFFDGEIIGSLSVVEYIGGFYRAATDSDGTKFTDCYATGKIYGHSGVSMLGGFTASGCAGGTTIDMIRCYASCEREGIDGSAFMSDYGGTINFENNYCNEDTVDSLSTEDNELTTPLSETQMKQQDSFEPEWDFDLIWGIYENDSYPFLLSGHNPPPLVITNPVTNIMQVS